MKKVLLTLTLLICLAACRSQQPSQPLPLLIITDIGTDVDDAEALCLAFNSNNLQVNAIACTAGQSDRRLQIVDTLTTLLAQGMEPSRAARVRATPCGYGTAFIDSVLQVAEQKQTVLLLAQATHLAEALQRNPLLCEKIERICFQGQAFCDSVSPVLRPNPEAFNVSEDVSAATTLFSYSDRIPFTLVGKYVVYPLALTRATVEGYRDTGKSVGAYLYRAACESLRAFAYGNPLRFAEVYHLSPQADLSTPQAIDAALAEVSTLTNPYDAVALLALLHPDCFIMQRKGLHALAGQTPSDSLLSDKATLQWRLAHLLD